MIIKTLLDLVYGLFSLLTVAIRIPSMPDGVMQAIDGYMGYIRSGIGILANFCNLGYVLVLFGVIVAVDIGVLVYKFVLWILKKIPMIGIE